MHCSLLFQANSSSTFVRYLIEEKITIFYNGIINYMGFLFCQEKKPQKNSQKAPMRDEHFDVVGIGTHCLDYLSVVDRYPEEDEKLEAEQIVLQGGGNIATACVAVARLGGSVCFHTVVGDDELAQPILHGLAQEGVDTRSVRAVEGKNPVAFVIINKSCFSRTILYSTREVPVFGKDDVDEAVIRGAGAVLVDFYHQEAALRAAEIARRHGIPVVVDAEKVKPLSAAIMDETAGLRSLLSRIAEMTSASFVCVTMGEQGAAGWDSSGGRFYTQKAFSVPVKDTTGAGDVFHGVFAFLVSQGWKIEDIMRYSSASAACACREVGGRSGIPTMESLERFLSEAQ
jgi:sulfofructose kinase